MEVNIEIKNYTDKSKSRSLLVYRYSPNSNIQKISKKRKLNYNSATLCEVSTVKY